MTAPVLELDREYECGQEPYQPCELKLWLAVLWRALEDLRVMPGAIERAERRMGEAQRMGFRSSARNHAFKLSKHRWALRSARKWVQDRGESFGSFAYCCDLRGINPDTVRAGLLGKGGKRQ